MKQTSRKRKSTANPSVSFIMPAFNAEKTIEQSLRSIIDGNLLAGDEIVVVNDCSTDDTAGVVEKLQKKCPTIRLISHVVNKGGGAARNTAIEHATHELIFCLDSDNILERGSVKKLRKFLVDEKADVATFETLRYFKTNTAEVTHTWKFVPKNASLAGALSDFKFPGASGNYLFTKDSWLRAGGYPEFAGALDAWGLGFRQVATGSVIKILPNSFYYHRYGHESYWMRESREGMVSLRALQIIIPYLHLLNEDDVNYIMGPKARTTWFSDIEEKPVRLASNGVDESQGGVMETIKRRLRQKA